MSEGKEERERRATSVIPHTHTHTHTHTHSDSAQACTHKRTDTCLQKIDSACRQSLTIL